MLIPMHLPTCGPNPLILTVFPYLLQHAMLFFLHYWELPTAHLVNIPRQRAIPVPRDIQPDLQDQLAEELPVNVQENQVPPPVHELSDNEDLAEVQPVEHVQNPWNRRQRNAPGQRLPHQTMATQPISGGIHIDAEGGTLLYSEQQTELSREECNIGGPSALVNVSSTSIRFRSMRRRRYSTNETDASVTNDQLVRLSLQ